MDCIYIDPDSGSYLYTTPGDCDNSTDELANEGNYVDGTVNTIYVTNGQYQGYSGVDDNGNPIVQINGPIDSVTVNGDTEASSLSVTPGVVTVSLAPNNTPHIPYKMCEAGALYNALSSLKSNTDKANSDLAKTWGLTGALAGPAAGIKWGMGGSPTSITGLGQAILAGIFVKTYFVTVPSWFAGVKQTDNQFKADLAACGGQG